MQSIIHAIFKNFHTHKYLRLGDYHGYLGSPDSESWSATNFLFVHAYHQLTIWQMWYG